MLSSRHKPQQSTRCFTTINWGLNDSVLSIYLVRRAWQHPKQHIKVTAVCGSITHRSQGKVPLLNNYKARSLWRVTTLHTYLCFTPHHTCHQHIHIYILHKQFCNKNNAHTLNWLSPAFTLNGDPRRTTKQVAARMCRISVWVEVDRVSW